MSKPGGRLLVLCVLVISGCSEVTRNVDARSDGPPPDRPAVEGPRTEGHGPDARPDLDGPRPEATTPKPEAGVDQGLCPGTQSLWDTMLWDLCNWS